jgi:hypothetical protein
MPQELTKQDILELFKESDVRFQKRLAEGLEKSRKELEKDLLKSRRKLEEDLERSRKEFDKDLKQSREEFDKKLGELTGTWGKFVEELVAPNSIQLFKDRGIEVTTSFQRVKEKRDGKDFYQIDLFLLNDIYAIAVEVKSTLSVADVKEHLKRLEKIQKYPPKHFDLKGTLLLGAVAGIIVDGDADKYAYKKGLFVLRQQGNIVEIVNDKDFVPREWKVE